MSIALIDCDDVLADFLPQLLKYCAPSLRAEDITSWDMFSFMSEHQAESAKATMADGFFWESLRVKAGSLAGYQLISKLYSEVYVVTRPWPGCDRWARARYTWLDRNFGIKQEQVVLTSQKKLLKGDLMLDDRTQYLEDFAKTNPHGRPVAIKMAHNHDWGGARLTWAEILADETTIAPKTYR